MSTQILNPPSTTAGLAANLLPIMVVVLVAFLIIGLAMPVLPLHVHDGLGLSPFVVGIVAGAQFAASLISRFWSGTYADTRGSKRAVVIGLWVAALSGALYYLSLSFMSTPTLSATILLSARALLGGGESFIITGALSWGLTLAGASNTGRVIAWIGTAMYVAFAGGAPIGSALYARYGFVAIALATALIPLATLLLVLPLKSVPPQAKETPAFKDVIGAVAVPGVGLALSSIGFGSVTTFIALLFLAKGWDSAWLAFSGFGIAFIIARLALGHLSDKIGGAKVALVFVLIEAVGQALIWLAPTAGMAFLGAIFTGFGYSLVYPGLGVEAVKRAPPKNRGLAMGAYTAFLDLALGIASPVLGLIASKNGIASVFLVSMISVLCAAPVALWLHTAPKK